MSAEADFPFRARMRTPFATLGVGADIRSVGSLDPDAYRVVSLPLYQMADPAVVDRLGRWVEAGGNLVLGYRAGARDLLDRNVDATLPGLFAELAGVRVPRFESLNETSAALRVGAMPGRGGVWADVIEPDGAETVAVWTDRGKFYRGSPAVTVNRVGEGRVWYVGTSPSPIAMLALYRHILKAAGLRPRFAGADVEAVERRDADGKAWRLVLNHSPKRRRAYGATLEPWGWVKLPAD